MGRLKLEIDAVRSGLTRTVAELDRRRHRLGGALKLAASVGTLLLALGLGLRLGRLAQPSRWRRRRRA